MEIRNSIGKRLITLILNSPHSKKEEIQYIVQMWENEMPQLLGSPYWDNLSPTSH